MIYLTKAHMGQSSQSVENIDINFLEFGIENFL